MTTNYPADSGLDLRRQLEQLTASYAASTTAETAAVMERAREELLTSGMLERSLPAGERAPDFTLPDPVGRPVHLANLLARGPVVVTFYRGAW